VGFIFPGMILDPGSFSGNKSSPIPHLGPHPNSLMSFAIFVKALAKVFKEP
jgi:hypothetical protein